MTPLALTDEQLSIVRTAAAYVPLAWRSRFLDGVADLLTQRPVTNGDVAQACATVARRIVLGVGYAQVD